MLCFSLDVKPVAGAVRKHASARLNEQELCEGVSHQQWDHGDQEQGMRCLKAGPQEDRGCKTAQADTCCN